MVLSSSSSSSGGVRVPRGTSSTVTFSRNTAIVFSAMISSVTIAFNLSRSRDSFAKRALMVLTLSRISLAWGSIDSASAIFLMIRICCRRWTASGRAFSRSLGTISAVKMERGSRPICSNRLRVSVKTWVISS